MLVKLREIKCKIERRSNAKDRSNNIVSIKDVVRVVDGPWRVRTIFCCIAFLIYLFTHPFDSILEFIYFSELGEARSC